MFGLALFGCASMGASGARAGTVVNLELALLVDVSGSISTSEFNLQKTGYANAFLDPGIQSAIAALAPGGGIAVTLMYWSSSGQQSQAVPWTQLTNATQATAFASAIAATSRPYSGQTAPGSALNAIIGVTSSGSITTFAENAFDGARQVIDVSGDGAENDGADTATARNAALSATYGIDQINGLAIGGGTTLLNWYNSNIKGGTAAFVVQANGFDDFEAALIQKLGREIAPVPEPGTLTSGLIGLVGAMLFARRRARLA